MLVLTVIILEVAARIIVSAEKKANTSQSSLTEEGYKADWKEQYFKDINGYLAATGGKQVYEPYTLWKNPDFTSQTFNIVGGYRRTSNPPTNSTDSTIKVFLFGGSTMFSIEVPDEYTIPSYVSRKLHTAFPNKRFEVTNWGIPGFVSDQEVVLLSRLLAENKRPDIVIIYDGVNDTRMKVGQAKPETHGFYELYDQIYRSITTRLWATLVWKSSLLTLVMRSRTEELRFEKNESVLQKRAEATLQHYVDNITFVNHLAQEYKFKSVIFWQPHLLTTNKQLLPAEAEFREKSSQQFGKFFTVMQQTVQTNVFSNPAFPHKNVYDLTGAYNDVQEHIFLDAFHVNAIGNEAVATKIVDCIAQKGILQP